MKKAVYKINAESYHVFNAGDLCSNQDGDLVAILGVKDGLYEKMYLTEVAIHTLNMGTQFIKKGERSTQPCSVFDKYHYLFHHKK